MRSEGFYVNDTGCDRTNDLPICSTAVSSDTDTKKKVMRYRYGQIVVKQIVTVLMVVIKLDTRFGIK